LLLSNTKPRALEQIRDNHHLFKEAVAISPTNPMRRILTHTLPELCGALFIQLHGRINFKIIRMKIANSGLSWINAMQKETWRDGKLEGCTRSGWDGASFLHSSPYIAVF